MEKYVPYVMKLTQKKPYECKIFEWDVKPQTNKQKPEKY